MQLTIESCAVISSRDYVDSFGWYGVVSVVDRVVDQHLVSALSGLSLHVVHVTPAEYYHFGVVGHAAVSVSTLDAVCRAEIQILPVRSVGARHKTRNFVIAFMILTTDQVAVIIYTAQSWVLPGSWNPALCANRTDLCVEWLSLLHSLDVGLETTSQALCEFVSRDIVWRCRFELLRLIVIVSILWFQNLNIRLLSSR